jgi:hypothetical protein
MVVASGQISSVGLRFYERSGSTFSPVSIPSGSLNVKFETADITPNGEYFCGNNRLYHNASGSLTFLQTIGTGTGRMGISPTGNFIACSLSSAGSGNFGIYKRSGSGNSSTYSQHQTFAITTNTNIAAARFSRDGTYLAISEDVTTPLRPRIYKYNSGTDQWTDLSQPPSGGTFVAGSSTNGGIAWSYDGQFVAISTGTFDSFETCTVIYERSGDTFTYRAKLSSPPSGFNQDNASGGVGSFHPNGNYYLTGGGWIYKKNSATSWTIVNKLISQLFPYGRCAAFSPNLT